MIDKPPLGFPDMELYRVSGRLEAVRPTSSLGLSQPTAWCGAVSSFIVSACLRTAALDYTVLPGELVLPINH